MSKYDFMPGDKLPRTYKHKQTTKKVGDKGEGWWREKMFMREDHNYKLGLSWAKVSCQLGFGCTVINICFLVLIKMK